MKNFIIKNLFLLVICLITTSQLSAMRRLTDPRTGRAFVGKYVRPNSKSSLRYFAVSPDRACTNVVKTTPTFVTTPRRKISTLGRFWPDSQENLTTESKQEQLFNDLSQTIYTLNVDKSLDAIATDFSENNLINTIGRNGLTPLQFAIEISSTFNPVLQKQVVTSFIENGAQLGSTKEFELALRWYNFGALKALIAHYKPTLLYKLAALLRNQIANLKNAISVSSQIILQEENPRSSIALRSFRRKNVLEENLAKLTALDNALRQRLTEPESVFETKEGIDLQ